MRRIHQVVGLLLVSAIGPAIAEAQPNVLRRGNKTVEVLGLRRWTLAMVQDSLAKYAPKDSLHTHGCAAALRYKVGFADAAAMGYRDRDGSEHTVIVVREPQDSARVQLRPSKFDTTGARREWADLQRIRRTSRRAFDYGVAMYAQQARTGRRDSIAAVAGKDSAVVRELWTLIAKHASERDRKAATLALLSDPNFENRLAAVAVLSNFGSNDETWWALVEAMREDDGVVKGAAAEVARGLVRTAPRAVDWTPVLPAIRAMLDGTSPFSLSALMEVLISTSLDASHVPYLLAGGDQLLFEYVGSSRASLREPARMLLKKLSGEDFGFDANRWREWARGLRAE